MISKKVWWSVLVTLFAWWAFLFVRPIDLTTGDLARHLKNGEVISTSTWVELKTGLFSTNFYSYTQPDFPFVNHHWLSGLVFYKIWHYLGVVGLELFGALLALVTLGIFFNLAYQKSNFWLASSSTFFLMPLLADRRDLRPELFSYLFLGLVIWLLEKNRAPHKFPYLLPIPLIFLAWVNLHIYFIFGFAILGIWWLSSFWQKNWAELKTYTGVIATSLMAGFINPFGLKVYLYPFTITSNFGIGIQETESVFKAVGIDPARLVILFTALTVIWVSIILLYHKHKKFDLKIILLAALATFLGLQMVRNFSLAGYLFLLTVPILITEIVGIYWPKLNFGKIKTGAKIFGGVVIVTLLINVTRLSDAAKNFGVTPNPVDLEAAEFLQTNQVTGQVFNDFSTGSYLILYGYPKLKPFVDQRPEAYPAEFLASDYKAVRSSETDWERVNNKYRFSVIFLALTSISPDNLNFIINRLNDPAWVPVFRNNKHLVFLKNIPANESAIAKNRIPLSEFTQ